MRGTGPDITAIRLSDLANLLTNRQIALNNDFWSHSISVSIVACHAIEASSTLAGTAKFWS